LAANNIKPDPKAF